MKKQLMAPLLLAALISAPSHSQSAGEGEKGKFTITPALVSDYYWRGQKQGGPSFQPAIGYEKGPWSFDLTLSVPLDEKMSDTVYPEFDFSASYEFSFANDCFKIVPGLIAYTYPTTDEIFKAVIEPTVTFAFAVKDLSLSLNLYYDVIQKGPTYEVVAGYTIPITERIGVELSAMAGKFNLADTSPDSMKYEDEDAPGQTITFPGRKDKSSGSYWQAGVSVPIELTKRATIVPGWFYSQGYDLISQTDKEPKLKLPNEGRGVFSLSFSYTF